jgi:hypothetical protein
MLTGIILVTSNLSARIESGEEEYGLTYKLSVIEGY